MQARGHRRREVAKCHVMRERVNVDTENVKKNVNNNDSEYRKEGLTNK